MTPRFQASGVHNCGRIISVLFKPVSLWSFVKAAAGNQQSSVWKPAPLF